MFHKTFTVVSFIFVVLIFTNNFFLLHLPFMEHLILWFDETTENRDNRYLTDTNESKNVL